MTRTSFAAASNVRSRSPVWGGRCGQHGREAVDLFRRTKPDVVTMDLTMPEMDGVECVQELVAINSKVLILVVSALADKATQWTPLRKGANGFLCKPFTDRQLNDAIGRVVVGALMLRKPRSARHRRGDNYFENRRSSRLRLDHRTS